MGDKVRLTARSDFKPLSINADFSMKGFFNNKDLTVIKNEHNPNSGAFVSV